MHPHAENPSHEVRSIIVMTYDGLGLCQLVQFVGRRRLDLVHTIDLSPQGNIALVALFASALQLDCEGSCMP